MESNNEKGLVTDKEIFEEELGTAKYWARDQIMNQLKTASKGSPKVQGNSIFGLGALANAVLLYEQGKIKTEESHQYVSMRSWLLKVADTIAVVFNGNIKTKSKPFQWCQQVTSNQSNNKYGCVIDSRISPDIFIQLARHIDIKPNIMIFPPFIICLKKCS